MSKDLQLSDAEWELMKVLWDIAPASVNEIAEKIQAAQWHPKTVRTMLLRLQKKGVVEQVTMGSVLHYQARYSRDECSSIATETFLQRVFDGALTPMVAQFTRKRRLTAEEKKALEQLLSESDD